MKLSALNMRFVLLWSAAFFTCPLASSFSYSRIIFLGIIAFIYTDISQAAAARQSQHQIKTPEVHLDFGLSVMLAMGDGDLYGRNWLAHLGYYDRRITRFAAQMQQQGKRPKESKRYRKEVAKLKSYIKTEVNRILNRIVEQKRSGMFAVERLDFRNPELSRRLNRIIQNCGRKAIKAKLAAIEEVLGVPTVGVNPAYTSKECSNCHYVDKRNRRDRDQFECKWCGLKLHADVNGARNTGTRRSGGQLGSVHLHRGRSSMGWYASSPSDGAGRAR